MDITTTCGEMFSYDDHARLAWLLHLRFGRDLQASTAAWRRMMQNSTPEKDFENLINEGARLAIEDGTKR